MCPARKFCQADAAGEPESDSLHLTFEMSLGKATKQKSKGCTCPDMKLKND